MHLVGADLDFHGLALRPDDRGVQGPVHPVARAGDVVLETPRDGVPLCMQKPQDAVAVGYRIDEYADPNQVVDVGEVPAPHDHLLVDDVVVLGPAVDPRPDPVHAQFFVHQVDDLPQVLVARRGPLAHEPDDLVVHLGVQRREGEILELPLDRVHAQPVCQRRKYLQGLARLLPLLVLGQPADRAHVVQPIGEFDDQHPDVAAPWPRPSCARSPPSMPCRR